MDVIVDIPKFMESLASHGATIENLVAGALNKLYNLEARFFASHSADIRNDVRITIAFVKSLYDHAQQLALAREYLLHKIKLQEVRESDLNAEISVLRDNSPTRDSCSPREANASVILSEGGETDDDELSILMDARMIRDIDVSSGALLEIRRLICDKKQEISDIERCMDGMSELTTSLPASALQESIPVAESHLIQDSRDKECDPEYRAGACSRDEDALASSSTYTNMNMSKEMREPLLPQGDFGTPSGRFGGEPDVAGSSSSKGTVGVDSLSAPTAQVATGEQMEVAMETEPTVDTQVDALQLQTREKRKASTSPDVEDDDAEDIQLKRPIKARVLESRSGESVGSPEQGSPSLEEGSVGDSVEPDAECVRVTRGSVRNKSQADFKRLVVARKKKGDRSAYTYSDSDSLDRIESIVEPIVSRV